MSDGVCPCDRNGHGGLGAAGRSSRQAATSLQLWGDVGDLKDPKNAAPPTPANAMYRIAVGHGRDEGVKGGAEHVREVY